MAKTSATSSAKTSAKNSQQLSQKPAVIPMTITKRRGPPQAVIDKAQAGLAKWRAEKAYAEKKGGKFLEAWNEEQAMKKAQKNLTPMQAIKNFCNECVGGVMSDINNCTATQCKIYMYRPYQKWVLITTTLNDPWSA